MNIIQLLHTCIRSILRNRMRSLLIDDLSAGTDEPQRTESVILSLIGGLLGTGVAFLVCSIMSAMGIPTAINPLIDALRYE